MSSEKYNMYKYLACAMTCRIWHPLFNFGAIYFNLQTLINAPDVNE